MKHLILIALAFTTLSITAQGRKQQHKKGEGMNKHIMKDMTPEEVANLRTKKMTLDFNLTDAQQKKIYDLNLASTKERRTKIDERKKAHENDSDKKPSKDEHYKILNERLDKQIAHKTEMQSILGKDQFQKWERQHKHSRKQHKRNGRKHRSRRSK